MCGLFRTARTALCLEWRQLQFEFSITLITEGIGQTLTISLRSESLVLGLNRTAGLTRCHSNAVGLNIQANDLELWVAFILLSLKFPTKTLN